VRERDDSGREERGGGKYTKKKKDNDIAKDKTIKSQSIPNPFPIRSIPFRSRIHTVCNYKRVEGVEH